MGWGDEIIVTGQARLLQQQNPGKVVVYDRAGRIRWHEIWRNNPRIVSPADRPHRPQMLINGPGVRPYIAAKTPERWTWKDWACPVGEIHFSAGELAFAAQHSPGVVIEPVLKAKASPNKDWGRANWTALAALLRAAGMEPCQIGPPGTQLLPGVRLIEAPGFREACAVLARARAAVLPEGGLHHAAAALGVKTVVIFGGYISPRQTGYDSQVNLFTGGTACGMRTPCRHCAQAMAAIAPDQVQERVAALLRESDR